MSRIGALHVTRATAEECAAREVEGRDLRAWREGAGLTRADVAAALGVSVTSYRRWEDGHQPIPPERREQIEALRARYARAS